MRDRTRLRRLSVPLNTATGTPDLADSTATNDRRPAFRADIEGLRALAVLLVVLYHSAFPGFSGGYVGVDVFFVISGYLITGTLLREASATSTIRMSRFWASRIRRLVPALTVMVIVTWIAGLAIQSPLGWSDLAREGMSAATYTSNILFAREAGGYFASTGSPFLHTWSLSVEEQFYIGWPILALVAVKVFPSRTGRRGWNLAFVVATVTMASFAASIWATNRGTPWAYFSAPTRAWEFGVGALLALAGARLATMGRRLQVVTVVAGLATILVAATRFDEQTPFPGFWAGVPVLGTAMVLLGGMHGAASLPSRLLGTSVPVFIGRLSYSWYLWHWPFLIMSARLLGPLSVPENLGVVTLALGAAAISYALVEAPLRRNALLRNPQWAISCGVLSVGVLVSLGMAINFAADRRMADPYLAALVAARDGRSESGPPESCSMAVIADEEYCVHGPTNASRLVLLVGDSHAAQWSPAVIEAAASSDARVLVRTYGGCPAIDVPVRANRKGSCV